MSRIAYVNSRYQPLSRSVVGIEDRGYQFADGVYEVVEVRGERLIDEDLHLERLRRSLGEVAIAAPVTDAALRVILREIVARNRVRDGLIYLQVTRGVAPRDHVFPDPPVKASLVVTAKAIDRAKAAAKALAGIRVITLPDLRWKRPDIKSVSLLPNVLAKEAARVLGAAEAWLIGDDGFIREGASSNAWIVDGSDRVITHQANQAILKGVTRTALLGVISSLGLTLDERPFSKDEAVAAKEAFITGATTLVMPVVAIDDRPVGNGRPGPIAQELRRRFQDAAQRS